jgi:hypothetical protein
MKSLTEKKEESHPVLCPYTFITYHTTEMKSLTDEERGKPPCSVPLYLHNLSYNRDEITHR